MRRIEFNVEQFMVVLNFKKRGVFLTLINTKVERKLFIRKYYNIKTDPGNIDLLVYYKFPTVILKIFKISEYNYKELYIKNIHLTNGHPGRDKLEPLIRENEYNYTRNEIMNVLKSCPW